MQGATPRGMNKNYIFAVIKKYFAKMTPTNPEDNKKPIIKHAVPKWYAIYTSPRAEKQVFTRLCETGVETFLPLQKTYRQWSDRKKLIEKPLLSSYVFVKVIPKEFPAVYKTTGVVKFVSFEGQAVPIPQNQIDNLKLLINSDAEIEVTSEKFAKGDNVEVVTGSLIGLTGELIKVGNTKRVIVRIDSLEKNIIVTIPTTFLRKI
jgi:transcription antitermination factor NusG